MWVGESFLWVGVNFLWVGVGWRDFLWVNVGRCKLFMGGCGSVWVGVQNDITVFFLHKI